MREATDSLEKLFLIAQASQKRVAELESENDALRATVARLEAEASAHLNALCEALMALRHGSCEARHD